MKVCPSYPNNRGKRAETRFDARGIDDNGNVANFVETEFIFNEPTREQITSFTQLGGLYPHFGNRT